MASRGRGRSVGGSSRPFGSATIFFAGPVVEISSLSNSVVSQLGNGIKFLSNLGFLPLVWKVGYLLRRLVRWHSM